MSEHLTIRQAAERCGLSLSALKRAVGRDAIASELIETPRGPVRMVTAEAVRRYLAERPGRYQDRETGRDAALRNAAERLGISIEGARLAQQRGHVLVVQRDGQWHPDDDGIATYAEQRKRERLGSANGRARLREADIPEIRRLRSEGWTLAAIAEVYQVGKQTIHSVVTRRTWKHIA